MPDLSASNGTNSLSVALIVPDAFRRRSLATALSASRAAVCREFGHYPLEGDLAEIVRLNCDVAIVDLDDDAEQGITAIENICSRNPTMTVMVYSRHTDAALMRRSMHSGAREFLTEPLSPEAISEALTRAAARRPNREKATGKILVYLSAKAGVGVTTVATNFALALTKESGSKVVLADMDFQLGEVALGLGMTAAFSVVDALQNPARLDREFLYTLLLRHSSGLAVLAAPEEYDIFDPPAAGVARLFQILRREFDYVVVDAGTCAGQILETLIEIADTVYLVTEMSFPALRNSHRFISFLSGKDANRALEVVVNRSNSRQGDIGEDSAIKAMGRPINWRIPNGYAAARAAQDAGVPLAMENSPVTIVLTQMARTVCGKPLTADRKPGKGFSFFGSKAMSQAGGR